ncbi:FAD-dependent monooxygenase [Hydrogenophaga sp. A37]|uniref:FAD-dependent monooxygenase n=1 Tax=Hydrogenophaga sp. A37 TaxID=1945864 RepID=UPI0009874DBB|nr:FAD-dependent monooxygenase [Hydrogenophaga sp. A37]OOG79058.1 FAD-dependent oxidoreductase [Hydrogenophaga sp. A37]
MTNTVVVAGGGIGGLACALALSRAGVQVDLLEQASAFGEVGAGIQLGPNAVRVLNDWGLINALHDFAAFPEALDVRDAHSATHLGHLRLGALARARYGQPYAAIHRADLHGLLLDALQHESGVRLHLGTRLSSYEECATGLKVTCENEAVFEADALIGADGLWSRVRLEMQGVQPARVSGHLAYRGMVDAQDLPSALSEPVVTAWLGPRLHVVHYPVRRGELFNVVAVVEGVLGRNHGGPPGSDPQSWSHEARHADLLRALGPVCPDLAAMLERVPEWKLWALNDRPPLSAAAEHARGRVALLGDAAHPLRPYLAQGAAMALEDAWTLGRLAGAAGDAPDWSALFARYADTRWQRNARVQRRSQRNGTIFHASGPLRWARNASMALLGESLIDNPWLYNGPPEPV